MINCFKSYMFTYKYETEEDLGIILKEMNLLNYKYKNYNLNTYINQDDKIYKFWFHVKEDNYKIKNTIKEEVLYDVN